MEQSGRTRLLAPCLGDVKLQIRDDIGNSAAILMLVSPATLVARCLDGSGTGVYLQCYDSAG